MGFIQTCDQIWILYGNSANGVYENKKERMKMNYEFFKIIFVIYYTYICIFVFIFVFIHICV